MASNVLISLRCGTDWWIQFVYTDAGGNPVALTAPVMEIRSTATAFGAPSSAGAVLYSSESAPLNIVISQPQSNVVLAKIAGSVTKNKTAGELGAWDCYATDPTGARLLLGCGTFQSEPNVSLLP